MKTLPPQREMLSAFRRSDPSYDGLFFTGVKTTSVFCRPSCTARKPLPKNVEFFGSAREAVFAGYRACKRCRPLEIDGPQPDWVGRLMNRLESQPRLRAADLRKMNIDPARARRYFTRRYGMTFAAYARGLRMADALTHIRQGATVTDVAIGNGYESFSGFRDAFSRTFGGPPGRRTAECIVTAMIESPLGPLLAGATDEGVCLLEFTDRRAIETQIDVLRTRFGLPLVPGKHDHLAALADQLKCYFDRRLTQFDLPLVYPGTDFQRRVWDALRRIPYGQTRSYEALAREIGERGAQRAVGKANGENRIAIVIPCHRVINKGGKLGGYGGGLWRKQFLLDLERGDELPGLSSSSAAVLSGR